MKRPAEAGRSKSAGNGTGRAGRKSPMIEAPEPYRSIIDQRMAHDRAYFEEHPGADSFTRPAVPGEFWPYQPPPGTVVEVTRITSYFRTRVPIVPLGSIE